SNKLVTGRGNLVSQVEKLRALGARGSKALPERLLERAGLPDATPDDAAKSRIDDDPETGGGGA
ncbi:MAG TPA: hypothetical protein VFN13_05975, partial [Rudaea sp.]|nr:hypothetical protein [Rudaea sp.]